MSNDSGAFQDALHEKTIGNVDVYESYKRSPYLSIKHSSYFHAYSELFAQYKGRAITFVEVGVLNGGSLFMWRDYFGPNARIIGVDFNPLAKKWEKEGFEIHIGSQSDTDFWHRFFNAVGPVDLVLDDGGHTFEQQIITVHCCIPHIKDGGRMVVEDTHTSYFRDFGYPTRYSFIEWTKKLIDNINSRFPAVKVSTLPYKQSVHSITFFESIVSMKIDRAKCFDSVPTSNGGISSAAQDFRHQGTAMGKVRTAITNLARRFPALRESTLLRSLKNRAYGIYAAHHTKNRLKRLGKFF
jgi:cephalosporin hydroxylase